MDLISNTSRSDTTLAQAAAALAVSNPLATAILFDDGTSLSYADAWERAQRLALAMQRSGLEPGDTLSFQLPNRVEAVVIALAASICGLVINPVVPIYRGRELSFILKDARTRIAFIPGVYRSFDFPAMLEELRPSLPQLEFVVCIGAEGELPEGFVTFEAFCEAGGAGEGEAAMADVSADDTKILLYTSGTTGYPKQVRHSHNTLAKALDNGATGWDLSASDLMLMPSPVTHITGYVNGIELPFFSATRSLLMEAWIVDRAISLIETYGATVCVSATPFLKELVDTCREAENPLPGFRLFACGGASVPPDLVYSASEVLADCTAVRVYGSTEVPLVTVGFPDPEQKTLAAETDGRVHNYDVIICDDDGADLGLDADGEILVRGPAMMLGYGDASQNRSTFTDDGYFRTGDIGRLLASGAIVITDRKKDIIIRGGENLSAREIEEAILLHPAVSEAAVVSAPHERLGEGVAVYVVPRPQRTLSLDDILEHLGELKLAKQKWPQHLEIAASLPKTASGKVQKEILRQQLRDAELRL